MSRRGLATIQFAFLLTVCLGFAALVIDRGLLQTFQQQMQNAVDATAHAAVVELDGTADGLVRAGQSADVIAAANVAAGQGLVLGETATLELGRWESGSFVHDTSDPTRVTAARVVGTRTDIGTIFAGIVLGKQFMGVQATAVVQGGGVGGSDCPIPLAIPSCSLPTTGSLCNLSLTFGADTNDSAGWANLGSSRPNANSVRNAIQSCSMPTSGTDVVTLNNGAINSAMSTLASAVSSSQTMWDSAGWGAQPAQASNSGVTKYGHVLEGELIVFEDPAHCAGTKFNGSSLDVTGFLSVIIYDVGTKGSVASRRIRLRTDCSVDRSDVGGGGYYGTEAAPHLVQ